MVSNDWPDINMVLHRTLTISNDQDLNRLVLYSNILQFGLVFHLDSNEEPENLRLNFTRLNKTQLKFTFFSGLTSLKLLEL